MFIYVRTIQKLIVVAFILVSDVIVIYLIFFYIFILFVKNVVLEQVKEGLVKRKLVIYYNFNGLSFFVFVKGSD